MRRAAPLACLATTAAAFIVAPFAGCSLDLDASKIDLRADGSAPRGDDASVESGGAVSPRADGAPSADGIAACAKDTDCAGDNACLRGRCDPASRTCLYDLCAQTTACSAASCDVAAATCALPVTYGFHAGAFPVIRGAVACGGAAAHCFAAVFPFVFVGTVNGVVAYSVANPANGAPPSLLVAGLPFLPQYVVASGRRVFFVGNPAPALPDFRLAIGWVDVPGSPIVTKLSATSLFVSYPHSTIAAVLPTTDGGIFLVNGDASRLFPTSIVRPPLRDGERIVSFPLGGIASGSAPVVASGTRLVAYRYDPSPGVAAPSFAFQNAAGTGSAQGQAEQSATGLGPLSPQPVFAQGPDGSVLFSAPMLVANEASIDVGAIRTAWLVDSASANAIDVAARVDIETYAPPAAQGGQLAGPIAWLDAKRALVTAAFRDDRAQTVVQVISRAQTPPGVVPNRRFVLPVAASSIGAASSEGTGYVLAPDSPDGVTVHVFAPGCGP